MHMHTQVHINSREKDSSEGDGLQAEVIEDKEGDVHWLYRSGIAVQSLFEGSHTSVLQALVKYFSWFCEHPGISKEALSSLLSMQHSMLPPGNSLPNSYESALSAIEPYLVQSVVYDVCRNDCVVFKGSSATLSKCPKCNSDRYVSERSHIPTRTFTYLPLKPRLLRMFGTSNMAQVLQTHAVVQDDDCIYDIQQSPAWKTTYSTVFKDSRGISLALCTDGVNPFAHNKVSYSMWPIMLTLLNLPRNLRNRFSSILLVGIVPSNGGQEPRDLNPFLELLVEELLQISSTKMYDAYQGAPFECKVAVLLHILDYPGIGKVMSVVGSGGLQGCVFCGIQGERDMHLNKTVYLQNRRYLPKDSKMRKDTKR